MSERLILKAKILTPELNQQELKRHRDIILATINYSSEKPGYTVKVDGEIRGEWGYRKLEQETEKYFQKGNLEKLQRILTEALEYPRARADLGFDNYIKEKTGYDIRIFANVEERVEKIVRQNRIKNEKEFLDVARMISKLRQELPDDSKIGTLHNLCRDFNKRRNKTKDLKNDHIPKEISHIQSSDKKFRLILIENENNGDHGMTTVLISGKNAGVNLYDVEGTNLKVKAYWKNNNTITIESKKEYNVFSKHHQIQFSDDVIEIEFIEK